MKKFIRSLFLFLAFTTPIYIGLVVVWGSIAPERFRKNVSKFLGSNAHTHIQLKEVKLVKDVEVLFIGSSRCYRGFDTRIFKRNGISSYNLGTSSQTPIQSEVLLKNYLRTLNPKCVVFEVNPLIFSLDGLESTLDIITNQQNDLATVQMALSYCHAKVFNSLIYNVYESNFGNRKKQIVDLEKSAGRYIKGGYMEKSEVYSHQTNLVIETHKMNTKQLEAFERILAVLKMKKIKVLLVQAPINSKQFILNKKSEQFDRMMRRYGKYTNFNNELKLNDSIHFYDKDHLNKYGVKIFNDKFLTKYKCFLTDI